VGAIVEVVFGLHAGRFGKVVQVSGEGREMRWRVQIEGDGPCALANTVKSAPDHELAESTEPPKNVVDLEVEVGAIVEVVSGKHARHRGTVVKVSGEGRMKQWLVQIDGSPCTWVNSVKRVPVHEIGEAGAGAKVESGPSQTNRPDFKFGDSSASRHGVPLPRHHFARGKVTRVDSEKRAAKEAEMREKAERKRAEAQKRREHFAALPPADVANVPWTQAKDIYFIDGGCGGATLVDLGDQCVVLKPQRKTATHEMVAQLIAPLCGVRVAQCRIVRYGEEEHVEITKAGLAFDSSARGIAAMRTFGVYRDDEGKVHCLGLQFFGVLEYVPGHPLMGLEAQRVLAAPDPSLLADLGQLCAMDILINNMDRLPLPVWQNDGNLSNVMVASESGRIVGIDQQVNPIIAGPGLDKYLEKVEHLIGAVSPGGDASAVLSGLRGALEINCGAELADGASDSVLQGMRLGFETIARAWKNGRLAERLEEAAALCADRLRDVDEWKYRETVYSQAEVSQMTNFVARVAEKVASLTAVGAE